MLARMYDQRRYTEVRQEGIEEGVERGREAQSKRLAEAYERFGVDVNGTLMLPNSSEVEEFLEGKDE